MSEIIKRHIYRIYRDGRYLGILKNVTSDFAYTYNINTAFTSLSITVEQNPINASEAVTPILTEDGIALTTELGEVLTTEGEPEVLGIANNDALIRNNNDVVVYEVSNRYPEGTAVFTGRIVEWHANIGTTDDISIEALSNGTDLDNVIVGGVIAEDQSQVVSIDSYLMYDPGTSAAWQRYGQTFTPEHDNLKYLYLDLEAVSASGTVIVKVWNGAADFYSGADYIGIASTTVGARDPEFYEFVFDEPVEFIADGRQYFFSVQSATDTQFNIYYNDDVDSYEFGVGLLSLFGGGGGNVQFVEGGLGVTVPFDLTFDMYYLTSATSTTFANVEAGRVVRRIMDESYTPSGGVITYTSITVEIGTTFVTYTFKVNTVWEAITKMLEFSPADWYVAVDPATGILYFKEASVTAEHTLIFHRHIESINLGASVKQVRNDVYYTGGDTGGGVNLYLHESDEDAVDDNGGWRMIERLTNNRVTLAADGTIEAQAFIEANKDQKYPTTVFVNDEAYDTKLFKAGQMVDFAGFGNSIDNLLLQIVSVSPTPYGVTLGLGTLPFKSSSQIDKLNRQLIATQTVDNPTSPS